MTSLVAMSAPWLAGQATQIATTVFPPDTPGNPAADSTLVTVRNQWARPVRNPSNQDHFG